MKAKHGNANLVGANCVTCHDPHVGVKGKAGLLKPEQHEPFAKAQCLSCHTGAGQTTTLASGQDLCFKCHAPSQAWLTKKVVHEALKTPEQCVACHSPHAGAGKPALIRKAEDACFACHDRKMVQGKNKHAALDGGCATCHDPHASDNAGLLMTAQPELCTTCHSDLSRHLHLTGGKDDPRTGQPLKCSSCHNPHSSDQASLLTHEPSRDLCIQCHDPAGH